MVDATANVVDFRDMTVLVGARQRGFVQLADEIGALPRTAGVRILYGTRVIADGTFPAFSHNTLTVKHEVIGRLLMVHMKCGRATFLPIC